MSEGPPKIVPQKAPEKFDSALNKPEESTTEARIIPQVNVDTDLYTDSGGKKWGTIHGHVSREERERIQTAFQSDEGRMLLMVSGQTADVGVDYSHAEYLTTYNEPWTEAERRQQLARAQRPGRTGPLTSRTLVARGTIEEGIHEYIKIKYQAIEKLLKGVPITEFEQNLLRDNEKAGEPDLEVNPELARYYFSAFEKLNKFFAQAKEQGEENFRHFLARYGEDYADCYLDLGSRSYQANVSRVANTLIAEMARARGPQSGPPRILDLASGPEMLTRHALPAHANEVVSLDLNINHFKEPVGSEIVVGAASTLPFADASYDYVNYALALHYTKFVPSKGEYERAEVLQEIARVLKPGGRAVITLIHSVDMKNVAEFSTVAQALGLRLVNKQSGMVTGGTHYEARVLTLEKGDQVERKSAKDALVGLSRAELDGLKFVRRKGKVKDSRRIISSFKLGDATHEIVFNENDQRAFKEEQSTITEMQGLKGTYGSIRAIPPTVLEERSMVRIRLGKNYILFKKLAEGGVVIEK